MHVVIDSGIWISAFQFKGTPLLALDTALSNHRIVLCPGIEDEVYSTLNTKFAWRRSQVRRAFAGYLPEALRLHTTGTVHGICRDPKDDMVLECALLAQADVLVSGDRDLLSLGTFGSTRILTARAYLDERSDPAP